MIYTVTFNPAIDYFISVDQLKKGEICRADRAKLRCGGKGINVSLLLTRLGIENTALGFIAGETGRLLRKMTKEAGVNCAFTLLKEGETRVNVKISSKGEYAVNAPGPRATAKDLRRLTARLKDGKPGDIVALSGAAAKDLTEEDLLTFLRSAKEKRLSLVVDASGKLLKNAVKEKPFLVKPNFDELCEYAEEKLYGMDDVVRAAKKIRADGAENVLVSLGEKGSVFLGSDGAILWAGIVNGKVVSTVGCGDCVLAGFLACSLKTKDLRRAFHYGAACGNAAALCGGTPTVEQIEKAAVNTEIKELSAYS